MDQRQMIILYVASQAQSTEFYKKIFCSEPVLDVPGMTEFEIPGSNMLLGLMPENGIAKILGNKTEHPGKGNGIPRCEFYLFVENPDKMQEIAIEAGATGVSKGEKRSWGDYVSYVMDKDGNILAFARRP